MKDLFGQEIRIDVKNPKRSKIKKKPKINPLIAVFGKGPEVKKCGSCAFHYYKSFAKDYPKCRKRTPGGAATDHSSRYEACGAYQEESNN
jgi:hypothetical protein